MSDTPRTDAALLTLDVAFTSYDGLASQPKEVVEPDFARQLERENAALEATLSMVYDANQRGIRAWQQAHPDKSMVWPDQAKLVEWLVNENAALLEDKKILDWMNNNVDVIMFKFEPDCFACGIREIVRGAMDKEAKP